MTFWFCDRHKTKLEINENAFVCKQYFMKRSIPQELIHLHPLKTVQSIPAAVFLLLIIFVAAPSLLRVSTKSLTHQ